MTFDEVSGGTEVTLVFENLPPGLRAAGNEAGSRLSLEQLARRFMTDGESPEECLRVRILPIRQLRGKLRHDPQAFA